MIGMYILSLGAFEITENRARSLADAILKANHTSYLIAACELIEDNDTPLAYVFSLLPQGYMAISAQLCLPPLIAYSLDSPYLSENTDNPLNQLLKQDLQARLKLRTTRNRQEWESLENYPQDIALRRDYLIATSWNQGQPWNMMCPLDPVSDIRSLAGCPAIAMGQIVNHLGSLNGTRFNNADDYYHSFSGRNYMIDDDFQTHDFPSFEQLNAYLDQVVTGYNYGTELSDSLEAALVFACGTALQQVYSSEVSGTFGVDQAFAAYQRLGFSSSELLGPDALDLYARINANLDDGYPVHLALLTPANDAGHNVVVDGLDDQGMYHLNFGWGGSYNGWYALPQGIPYDLSVIEGAVVDIIPPQRIFCLPASLEMSPGESRSLEIMNLIESEQVLLDIVLGENLAEDQWQLSVELPANIEAYGMLTLDLNHIAPTRETIESEIRLVFDETYYVIPLTFSDGTQNCDAQSALPAPFLNSYPNPFNPSTTISYSIPDDGEISLTIYNAKGQLVNTLVSEYKSKGNYQVAWHGKDSNGSSVASGLYFTRLVSGKDTIINKILLMK